MTNHPIHSSTSKPNQLHLPYNTIPPSLANNLQPSMAATRPMLHPAFTLLILLITCHSSSSSSTKPPTTTRAATKQKCHPHDVKVLLQINKALGNPTISFPSQPWDPAVYCCYWSGVSCDRNTNRVNFLSISGLNHSRPFHIPPAVGNLPYLQMLGFDTMPNLTGPIPKPIANLKKLEFLTISGTGVSGEIPEFLSELKLLASLDLSNNNLSGPIPSSLPRLRKLQGLALDGNRLSGSIPDSFGSFGMPLLTLTLSGNQLSGKIPASLGKLNLVTVDLSRNELEGDGSVLFGSHKWTNQMRLSRNSLAFDLGKVGLSKDLRTLDLGHNRIFGRIPQGMAALKDLDELDVSYNELCGEIPKGGKLQSFNATSFAHNKCLCGPPLPNRCK